MTTDEAAARGGIHTRIIITDFAKKYKPYKNNDTIPVHAHRADRITDGALNAHNSAKNASAKLLLIPFIHSLLING